MTQTLGNVAEVVACDPVAALQFDAFVLIPRRRQLTLDGEDVHIGARAFDLLVSLASQAGEILSQRELIEAAWPRRVVSDNNLKTQISKLQKILGHAPFGGRYIKNVALRGYVFVASVRPASSTEVEPASAGSPARPGDADPDREVPGQAVAGMQAVVIATPPGLTSRRPRVPVGAAVHP